MRTSFAVAALAGSAIAVPYYGYGHHGKEVTDVHVVVETVVKTVYLTEGYGAPTPTPSPVYQAPAETTIVYEEPVLPSSTYEAPPYVAPTPEAPAPTPEAIKPTPTPSPPPAPQAGYMGCVDEWRAKLGLKPLIHDDKLESNAKDTVVSSNGQMVHKLNPGSYGQVLAPGDVDSFEHVFVGGWLCEIPTLPGLDGVCATQSKGWSYEGQTGHAEILTSPNYSKIACANHAGIWCCDLA